MYGFLRDNLVKGQDKKDALACFSVSAGKGNVKAQYYIGIMCLDGFGFKQDSGIALKWLSMAAKNGYVDAQYSLGNIYRDGKVVKVDYKEAFTWYLMAAEAGDEFSQYNIGVMYDNGYGVKQNDSEALKWYLMAANKNLSIAQYNVGIKYYHGLGVKQNKQEAVKWFEKAAISYEPAMYLLSLCYYKGEGVDQDSYKALEWLRHASAAGNKEAKEYLATLVDGRWEKITENEDFILWVDVQTRAKVNRDTSKFWTKQMFKDNKYYDYSLNESYIDCNKKVMTVNKFIYYKNNNKINERNESRIYNIIPATVNEMFYEYFCQ